MVIKKDLRSLDYSLNQNLKVKPSTLGFRVWDFGLGFRVRNI